MSGSFGDDHASGYPSRLRRRENNYMRSSHQSMLGTSWILCSTLPDSSRNPAHG